MIEGMRLCNQVRMKIRRRPLKVKRNGIMGPCIACKEEAMFRCRAFRRNSMKEDNK